MPAAAPRYVRDDKGRFAGSVPGNGNTTAAQRATARADAARLACNDWVIVGADGQLAASGFRDYSEAANSGIEGEIVGADDYVAV